MAINSTHPLFDQHIQDWILLRDCYSGERAVKARDTDYLPATPGMNLDGMKSGQLGRKNYDAYKQRAVFHDFVNEAVQSYIGLLHQNPPTFELPPKMKGLLEKATIHGESLETLLRRINEQQLVTGRLGLLVDLPLIPDPAEPLPYITMYISEAIRNWDDSADDMGKNSLNLVVLDETCYVRMPNFIWKLQERYRVLELLPAADDSSMQQTLDIDEPEVNAAGETATQTEIDEAATEKQNRIYKTGVFNVRDGMEVPPDEMRTPMIRGQVLDHLPFVFINSKDIVASPDQPPLLGLAQLAMSIYQGEADYRQVLFLQGQDTLVVVGGIKEGENGAADDSTRVGAGTKIEVDVNGDAKYIGVNSNGLPEMRMSLENDRERATHKSGALNSGKNKNSGRESGEALRIRMAAQTATLTSIAKAGAAGLEQSLKGIATWMGENPDDVKVNPNLEFTDFQVDGKEIVDLMTARAMGAPLSLESIHNIMVDRGLTQMKFEEEMTFIEQEDAGRVSQQKKLGLDMKGDLIPPPPPPAPGPGGKPATKAPPAGGKGPARA